MDLPSSSLAAYPKKVSVRSLRATIIPFLSTATAESGMRDRKVARMSRPLGSGASPAIVPAASGSGAMQPGYPPLLGGD